MDTTTTQSSNINPSDFDPIKKLYGIVIGTATKDGMTIRGRLIKCDGGELWLEKITGEVVMIARSGIDRIWISRDCQKVSQ